MSLQLDSLAVNQDRLYSWNGMIACMPIGSSSCVDCPEFACQAWQRLCSLWLSEQVGHEQQLICVLA